MRHMLTTVSIDGTDYTASPSELVIGSFDPNRNNAVLFTGSLTVTSAPSVLALAASLRRSRRSAFSTSVSD